MGALSNHGYKRVVTSRSPRPALFDFRSISVSNLARIIAMNVGKAQHLTEDREIEDTVIGARWPSLSEERMNLDLSKLLSFQGEPVEEKGRSLRLWNRLFFCCENWPRAINDMWKEAISVIALP